MNGEFGLHDIYLSIPSVVGNQGIEKVIDISLNEEEKQKLIESATALQDVIQQLDI